jgi:hypothetical protein
MSNINRIRKYYATMDKGEKAYMANKLFHDDKVVPIKLRQFIPEELLYIAPPRPRETIERGNFFSQCGENYVLASIDSDMMCLISVRDGNRWTEGVDVTDCRDVTDREFNAICSNTDFKRV